MNEACRRLHALGQGLWLDSLSRPSLRSGALQRHIDVHAITGLGFTLSSFAEALASDAYDSSIRLHQGVGMAGEDLLFELALEDLRQAAQLFRPSVDASEGVDGWVSLGISPLLADNTAHTIQAAARLFERADTAKLFITIPGTPEGVRAVEELIVDGIPVNVSLLFSPDQYLAAAEAYLRGIERRLAAGLDATATSVASVFVSPWDVAVQDEVSPPFHNRLGIAMAMRSYGAHRALLESARWQGLAAAGARPQRLVWASTGTQDPAAPDTLYVQALAAAGTIDMLPEQTLLAFADHGQVGTALPADGGYADAVLEEFRREGVDDEALANRLQRDGVEALALSWHSLLSRIAEKVRPGAAGGSGEDKAV